MNKAKQDISDVQDYRFDVTQSDTSSDESVYDGDVSSNEDEYDDSPASIEEFIKDHISCLFDPSCEISFEDKFKFGELMQSGTSRLNFAKYMDAHRSKAKCVDETTFYKLLHSFALVLFECGHADDYRPGKSLMNMAFTYHCEPHVNILVNKSANGTGPLTDDKMTTTNATPKWRSNSRKFLRKRKFSKINQALKENTTIQKLKTGIAPYLITHKKDQKKKEPVAPALPSRKIDLHPDFLNQQGKLFLYERLKHQQIWNSMRFWDESFLVAVNDESKHTCSKYGWGRLSAEEKETENTAIINITFCQLLNFISNMRCLGLSDKMCETFLAKHRLIGGIPENGEYHKTLLETIRKAPFTK